MFWRRARIEIDITHEPNWLAEVCSQNAFRLFLDSRLQSVELKLR